MRVPRTRTNCEVVKDLVSAEACGQGGGDVLDPRAVLSGEGYGDAETALRLGRIGHSEPVIW